MQSISTEHREKLGFKVGLITNDSIKDAEKAPGAANDGKSRRAPTSVCDEESSLLTLHVQSSSYEVPGGEGFRFFIC